MNTLQPWLNLCLCLTLALSQGFAAAQGSRPDGEGTRGKTVRPVPYALDEDAPMNSRSAPSENAKDKDASPKQVRLFHEVLEELLAEFAYDVKAGQLAGLKNLSIRKVTVSESLPRSYQSYVELLVSEKIKANSKVKLISCLPCKTKNTRIVDDKLMISSPTTNAEDMNRTAQQLSIDNFMDVVLVYHSTHMVLAFQVFDTSSKELNWTHTYNSETIKSRYQRLAVDFSQIEKARGSEEYVPEFRYLIGFGAGSIPNVSSGAREKSILTLQLRGTEKFDNRRSEFGLLATFNIATSSLASEYPSEGTTTEDGAPATDSSAVSKPTPFKSSIGLFALFAHNFLGNLESYNDVRQGINGAIGLHLASGYLAPALRVGWDVYLGRRFSVNSSLILVNSANILVKNKFVRVPGGVGGDVAISYNL